LFWKRQKTRTVTFYMNVRFETDAQNHGYEQPVEAFLTASQSGKLLGHGAFYAPDRTEVLEADFSLELTKFDEQTIEKIVGILEDAGAPLGCRWSFNDTYEEANNFGTLEGLLLRFVDLPRERHQEFEKFLPKIIANFHEKHSDTAGFQGAVFSATKVTVSFHGFEYDVMKRGLEATIAAIGDSFDYEIERTTKLAQEEG